MWTQDFPKETVGSLVAPLLAARGEAAALLSPRDGGWEIVSARALLDRILGLALGLLEYGAEPRDRIAIVAAHGEGPLIAELAAQWAGLVVVSLDPELSDDQLRRILIETEARQALVSDLPTLRRILAIRPELSALDLVLLFTRPDEEDRAMPATLVAQAERLGADRRTQDPGLASRMIAATSPETHARWLYPVTAGRPQRIVQTHREVVRAIEALATALPVAAGDRLLAALPVASSSLFAIQCHALRHGGVVAFARAATSLETALSDVRPNVVVATRAAVEGWAVRFRATLFGAGGPRRWLAHWKIQRAHARFQASLSARRVLTPVTRGEQLLDALSLGQPRSAATGGSLKRFVSVGAALDDGVARFLFGAGIPCYEAAAAPEVAGLVSITTAEAWKPGSAGRPVPGLELRSRGGRLEARGCFVPSPVAATEAYLRTSAGARAEATVAYPNEHSQWVETATRGELDSEGYVRLT